MQITLSVVFKKQLRDLGGLESNCPVEGKRQRHAMPCRQHAHVESFISGEGGREGRGRGSTELPHGGGGGERERSKQARD